ncbi:MAG TPA: hypothetical protein VK118_05080 [Tetragenococcus sp.]|nr:hypothetical protein [Tetragenococcus sp.]
MKIVDQVKRKVTQAAQTAYHTSKKDVAVSVSKGHIQVKKNRLTQQRIKWQAKIH